MFNFESRAYKNMPGNCQILLYQLLCAILTDCNCQIYEYQPPKQCTKVIHMKIYLRDKIFLSAVKIYLLTALKL